MKGAILHRVGDARVARRDLENRIVDSFRLSDARYALSVEIGLTDPREALTTLAMVRETWESILPGLGERLIAEQTEQVALRLQSKKEVAA